MSLAGFVKKKKPKGKKPKAFKLDGEPAAKPAPKKKPVVIETPKETETTGWMGDDGLAAPSFNALASTIGVVDTRAPKDKPQHENYAKDMEAVKKKMGFHDARRAFQARGEEKRVEQAPAPAPTSRWVAKPASTRLNIKDTEAFPTLGGGTVIPVSPPVMVQNLWNRTVEEDAELIHMALKAEKKQFVPCTRFWGYEFGYFFKNGPDGLGYYKDPHPRDIYEVEATENATNSTSGDADADAAATTATDSGIPGASPGGDGVSSRFAKKKKKKKKELGDGADGEKKEKKKKKKKDKDKTGDGEDAGEDADGKSKKKKKKKKAKPTADTEGTGAVNGSANSEDKKTKKAKSQEERSESKVEFPADAASE